MPCRIQFGDTAGYKPALRPEGAPLIFGVRVKCLMPGEVAAVYSPALRQPQTPLPGPQEIVGQASSLPGLAFGVLRPLFSDTLSLIGASSLTPRMTWGACDMAWGAPHFTKTSPHGASMSPRVAWVAPHAAKASPQAAPEAPHTIKVSPRAAFVSPRAAVPAPHGTRGAPRAAWFPPHAADIAPHFR
jgi:hypothetical protein